MQVKRVLAAVCCCCCLAGGAVQASEEFHDVKTPVVGAEFPVEEPAVKPNIQERTKAILDEYNDPKRPKTHHGVELGHVYIPKGTPLMLALQEPISSKTSKEGKAFKLKSLEDVVINDVVVIPAGTTCVGKVLKGRGNRGFGRGGKLELSIAAIKTLNGVTVPLNGYIKGRGKKSSTWFAPRWISAFLQGKELNDKEGKLFRVTVSRNTDLKVTGDELGDAMGYPADGKPSIYVKPME